MRTKMCFGKNFNASTRPPGPSRTRARAQSIYIAICLADPCPSRCGRCMYNRAVLLERDGLLTEAEDMQRRCLLLRERVLGQDNEQVYQQ